MALVPRILQTWRAPGAAVRGMAGLSEPALLALLLLLRPDEQEVEHAEDQDERRYLHDHGEAPAGCGGVLREGGGDEHPGLIPETARGGGLPAGGRAT